MSRQPLSMILKRLVVAFIITAFMLAGFMADVTPAQALSSTIVISQAYGGGGLTGATYRNDFVELFNRSIAPVVMTNWTIHTAAGTGTSWTKTTFSGTIPAGGYYLVQLGSSGANGAVLPTPNATSTTNIGDVSGKVILTNNSNTISGACPTGGAVVDTLGYGTGTTCSEGAPTGNLSATTAAIRGTLGCKETDANPADFSVTTPNPRNSSTPVNVCADDAPFVVSSFPTDGATNVLAYQTFTITFSEPVTQNNAFSLQCNGTPISLYYSGGPTVFSVAPEVDMPYNATCVFTVTGSLIVDQDLVDPPNTMVGDYVINFTSEDATPAVISTVPTEGTTNFPAANNLIVTFSEPVTVNNAFLLECGTGPILVPEPVAVTGGPTQFIVDPVNTLPPLTPCILTVGYANVSDVDLLDPPDFLDDDYILNFTTSDVDNGPTVVSAVPANGATGVPLLSPITIGFSEPVTSNAAFSLVCGGVPQGVNVTDGPSTYTITPTVNMPHSTLCTFTVIANNISDDDLVDPPDHLAADFVTTFTTVDIAPTVTATVPTNGITGFPVANNLSVTFSEPVTPNNAFTLTCNGSSVGLVVSGGPNTFTLDPVANLANSTPCTLTVTGPAISDNDTFDPPDKMAANYSISFTTQDATPAVTSTYPVNGATGIFADSTLTVTFSEPVTQVNAFSLSCNGIPAAFDVTGGPTTFTIDPLDDLTTNVNCTLGIAAANVADNDTDDPPNNMAANVAVTFATVDAAPKIVGSTPANNSTGFATNGNMTITFAEEVTLINAVTLTCNSTPVGISITGGPITFTVDPLNNLAHSAECVLSVTGANVGDNDTDDPPDTMVTNYTLNFRVIDAAPSVTSTTPINGATGFPVNNNLSVTFSEPVTLTNAITLSCNSVPVALTVTGGPTTFTVDPQTSLVNSANCVLAVAAANVADNDTDDPPNGLASTYTVNFTVIDTAPSVTGVTPINGATSVPPSTNMTVTFSEPVTLTNAIVLTCDDVPVAANITGGPTTFTVNPLTDLALSANCTLSVVAGNVSDNDTDDPPDGMASNFTSTFRVIDAAPTITGTFPTNGATNISPDLILTVTFSEPVIPINSFDVFCDGTPYAVNVTGGPITFNIDPVDILPNISSCSLTVTGSTVADMDDYDPPNYMVGDLTITFATSDIVPAVIASVPANNSTDIAVADNLTVTFSEPVAQVNAFSLKCNGTPFAIAVTGGPTVYTIDPALNLPLTAACQLKVAAANVVDVDTDDPPDNLAADVLIDFSTIDYAPTVAATVPAHNQTQVPVADNLTVTFNEGVVQDNAFTLTCNSVAVPFTVSGGPTTFTIDPTNNLPNTANCVLTVIASQITDTDPIDPPDLLGANVTVNFATIDLAPAYLTSVPLNGAINVNIANNLTFAFTEFVTQTNAFSLKCNGTVIPFVVSGGPQNFVINPDINLPYTANCELTATGSQIADNDTFDPPNNMASNVTISFKTPDLAPTVTTSTPADNTANFAVAGNLSVTFSEDVTASAGAFGLLCRGANVAMTVTGGPRTFTLNPTVDLAPYALCRLTVDATKITDNDTFDTPDNMAQNFYVDFSTIKFDTIGVFRPSNQTFYLRTANSGGNANLFFIFTQYLANDIPLVGDWNGDGVTTTGIYRPSNSTFYLKNTNSPTAPVDLTIPFGIPGDIPVVGDWDGNGTDTIGVFRPSQAKFYLRNSNNAGGANLSALLGMSTDKPLTGDWDNNGTDTVGVWRSSVAKFFLSNAASGTVPVAHGIFFGISTDLPLVGDWNGDGADSVGLFRPSNTTFFLRQEVGNAAVTSLKFGLPTDKPLAGVWSAIPAFPAKATATPEAPSFVPKQ